MSVAFSAARNVVPGQDAKEISTGMEESEVEDSHSARCAWSFCTGQDRELPSSSDEAVNLINLREVKVKYGSQPTDGESDTEESAQSCDISARTRELAGAACIAVTAAVVTGVSLTIGSTACLLQAKEDSKDHLCLLGMGQSLPFAVAGAAFCFAGVKQFVDAYRAGNNA